MRRGCDERGPLCLTTNDCSIHSPLGTFSAYKSANSRIVTWLTHQKQRTKPVSTVPWPPLSPRNAVTLFSKVCRKSFSATTLEPNRHTCTHLKTHRKLFNLKIAQMLKSAQICYISILITIRNREQKFLEKSWSTGGEI